MILGPTNPPMLATQLMNPIAAAAAELVRNAEGNAQNEGRYAVVPNPIKVNTRTSHAFECGTTNHAPSAKAAINWGRAKCQRRSCVRSEFQPRTSIPTKPAPKINDPIQLTCRTLHPVKRWSKVGSQNQKA